MRPFGKTLRLCCTVYKKIYFIFSLPSTSTAFPTYSHYNPTLHSYVDLHLAIRRMVGHDTNTKIAETVSPMVILISCCMFPTIPPSFSFLKLIRITPLELLFLTFNPLSSEAGHFYGFLRNSALLLFPILSEGCKGSLIEAAQKTRTTMPF